MKENKPKSHCLFGNFEKGPRKFQNDPQTKFAATEEKKNHFFDGKVSNLRLFKIFEKGNFNAALRLWLCHYFSKFVCGPLSSDLPKELVKKCRFLRPSHSKPAAATESV